MFEFVGPQGWGVGGLVGGIFSLQRKVSEIVGGRVLLRWWNKKMVSIWFRWSLWCCSFSSNLFLVINTHNLVHSSNWCHIQKLWKNTFHTSSPWQLTNSLNQLPLPNIITNQAPNQKSEWGGQGASTLQRAAGGHATSLATWVRWRRWRGHRCEVTCCGVSTVSRLGCVDTATVDWRRRSGIGLLVGLNGWMALDAWKWLKESGWDSWKLFLKCFVRNGMEGLFQALIFLIEFLWFFSLWIMSFPENQASMWSWTPWARWRVKTVAS